MRAKLLTIVSLATFAVLTPYTAQADETTATTQAAYFEALKTLVGTYIETGEPDKTYTVTYALISRDSAITEMWESPTGRQELSVFHMSNGTLAATHYCASGVQSTMKLVEPAEGGALEFKLKSVSNLLSADKPHVAGFSYRFKDNTRIKRSETWNREGKESHSETILIRQTD